MDTDEIERALDYLRIYRTMGVVVLEPGGSEIAECRPSDEIIKACDTAIVRLIAKYTDIRCQAPVDEMPPVGWFSHDGGDRPVGALEYVVVQFSNGDTSPLVAASDLAWNHHNVYPGVPKGRDIIRYRFAGPND